LELIDVQGKHKGFVSYNKNQGTSVLKKHVCHEHLNLYKKRGRFLLHRVAKTQSDNKGQRKAKLSPLLKSLTFLAANGLTTNQNRHFWNIGSICCKGLSTFVFC
jgi:hypothetical protein